MPNVTWKDYKKPVTALLVAVVAISIVAAVVYLATVPAVAKPSTLYSYAVTDVGQDVNPSIEYGNGKWIVVWASNDDLQKGVKNNNDILFTSSVDGKSFGAPQLLCNDPELNTHEDGGVDIASDGNNNWFVVWSSKADINGQIKEDSDIVGVRSLTNGASWENVVVVNRNADKDSVGWYNVGGGDPEKEEGDGSPKIFTNGNVWTVAWTGKSTNFLPGASSGYNKGAIVYSQYSDNLDDGTIIQWWGPYGIGNCDTDDHYSAGPAISGDNDGNWVIAFNSDYPFYIEVYPSGITTGDDDDIYFVHAKDASSGNPWSTYTNLTSYACDDNEDEWSCAIASYLDMWVVVWESYVPTLEVDGVTMNLGADSDLFVSVSLDDGKTWSSPRPLNSNAESDTGRDFYPDIVTNGFDWVVVWSSTDDLNGNIGNDADILMSTSQDGLSWSAPKPLHNNAYTDTGEDLGPKIATDGTQCVVVWYSNEDGGSGADYDILMTDFTLPPLGSTTP